MGKNDLEYNRYKVYAIDSSGKKIDFFDAKNIEEVDSFTINFLNKNDLLDMLNKRYDRKFVDFYIESKVQKKQSNESGKIISDIIYMENYIPEIEKLQQIYIDYLLEDRRRIRTSFGYFKPSFKNENVNLVEPYRLISSVKNKIKKSNYMNIRKVYFELLHAEKIKTVDVDLEEEKKEPDYSRQLISSVDTDYPDINPERITEQDVRRVSDFILFDKIRNGEVEPFEYYDIEDYVGMSEEKGRGR